MTHSLQSAGALASYLEMPSGPRERCAVGCQWHDTSLPCLVPGVEWADAYNDKSHVVRYFTNRDSLGNHVLLATASAVLRNGELARTVVDSTVGSIVAEKYESYEPRRSRAAKYGRCPLTAFLKKCVANAALAELAAVHGGSPLDDETEDPGDPNGDQEAGFLEIAIEDELQKLLRARPGVVVAFCVAYGQRVLTYRQKHGSSALQSKVFQRVDALLLNRWLCHANRTVRAAAGIALGRRGHPFVRYIALNHVAEEDALLLRQYWYGIGPHGAERLPTRGALGAALGLAIPAGDYLVGNWLNGAAERLENVFA